MSELSEAERFIWTRLVAWAPLDALVGDRIFNAEAPEGEAMPHVIFAGPGLANDVRGIGTVSIQTDPLFIVKAVDESASYDTVDAIATQIQRALHGQRDPGGPVLMCVRESILSYPELTDGRHFRHRGGNYRLTVASIDG